MYQELKQDRDGGGWGESMLTVFLHHLQELHDDLRRWPDHDLALATLFSVGHVLEAVSQHGNLDHCKV